MLSHLSLLVVSWVSFDSPIQFASLVEKGLLDFTDLADVENAVVLCPLCHRNFDSTRTGLIFLPADLDYFIEAEELDYKRRKPNSTSEHSLRRICPSAGSYRSHQITSNAIPLNAEGGLYVRHTLRDYFPRLGQLPFVPGSAPSPARKVWHGSPMAALYRSWVLLSSFDVDGIPDDTLSKLQKLHTLYKRGPPDPDPDPDPAVPGPGHPGSGAGGEASKRAQSDNFGGNSGKSSASGPTSLSGRVGGQTHPTGGKSSNATARQSLSAAAAASSPVGDDETISATDEPYTASVAPSVESISVIEELQPSVDDSAAEPGPVDCIDIGKDVHYSSPTEDFNPSPTHGVAASESLTSGPPDKNPNTHPSTTETPSQPGAVGDINLHKHSSSSPASSPSLSFTPSSASPPTCSATLPPDPKALDPFPAERLPRSRSVSPPSKSPSTIFTWGPGGTSTNAMVFYTALHSAGGSRG